MTTFLLPVSLTEELERMLNSFWWGSGGDSSGGIRWMRWDKLCVKKEKGGLGFRKFQLFNLAMLGKIGWRLTVNPDALVCRVFKAKYFPNGDFLSAEIGHSPSFTWRSIWSAQDLLRSGTRWKVGNGADICVFQDHWLRRERNFYIHHFHDHDLYAMKVSDLMMEERESWDAELVEGLFDEYTARERY